jgi:hypothetical protein
MSVVQLVLVFCHSASIFYEAAFSSDTLTAAAFCSIVIFS